MPASPHRRPAYAASSLQQRCCCVYVRVRICSVCPRVAKRAAACSADDFDAESTYARRRESASACARTCSACKVECVLFVTDSGCSRTVSLRPFRACGHLAVHTSHTFRACGWQAQPTRRRPRSAFQTVEGRSLSAAAAAGRWREYRGSTAVVPLICSDFFEGRSVLIQLRSVC
jgi:hypothetical protein